MIHKNIIRRQLILQRKQLAQSLRLQKSQLIVHHVLRSSIFQAAHAIACYLPFQGEVETQQIMAYCWEHAKACYLPAVQADHSMYFLPYDYATPLEINGYGIKQPAVQVEQIKPVEQLDLILMPTVAFDELGNRLGSGAGYYDRMLAFKHQQKQVKPLLLGMAYDFQRVEQLARDPWDVTLDGVITESGLRLFCTEETSK